jgi:hypothetical protein
MNHSKKNKFQWFTDLSKSSKDKSRNIYQQKLYQKHQKHPRNKKPWRDHWTK